jgi:hypothetical protein
MNIIPVIDATLDIIEKLNDGVRPIVEVPETYYVYRGENELSEIISSHEFETRPEFQVHMAVIKICYLGI